MMEEPAVLFRAFLVDIREQTFGRGDSAGYTPVIKMVAFTMGGGSQPAKFRPNRPSCENEVSYRILPTDTLQTHQGRNKKKISMARLALCKT